MAIENIYMISPAFIKENSIIDKNTADEDLYPHIIDAQEIDIQRILGSELYLKILSDIKNGSLAGVYLTLRDKLARCLMWYSIMYATPYIAVNYGNKTIAQMTSENTQPLDQVQIDKLVAAARNRAEHYAEALRRFLIINESNYPEYDSDDDNEFNPDKSTAYECPISLGDEPLTNQELNYLNDTDTINPNDDE